MFRVDRQTAAEKPEAVPIVHFRTGMCHVMLPRIIAETVANLPALDDVIVAGSFAAAPAQRLRGRRCDRILGERGASSRVKKSQGSHRKNVGSLF